MKSWCCVLKQGEQWSIQANEVLWRGKLEVCGALGMTRVDVGGSSAPQAGAGSGPGLEGGTETGGGCEHVVQPPAAAPRGPGCAEAGAELGPCCSKQKPVRAEKITLYMVKVRVAQHTAHIN